MDLPIFGSPGRTSVEEERDLSSPGRAEVRKAELQILGSQGSAEVRKRNFTSLKVPAERDEMRKWTYPYLEVLAEQVWKTNEILRILTERKYGKWNFRSLAVKAEQKCGTKLHIFGSPDRDEIGKWTYPYSEVLVEQVRTKNEIF